MCGIGHKDARAAVLTVDCIMSSWGTLLGVVSKKARLKMDDPKERKRKNHKYSVNADGVNQCPNLLGSYSKP